VNATTNHINTHESRAVRGARFVFLFGCGHAALGSLKIVSSGLSSRLHLGKLVHRSLGQRVFGVFSLLSWGAAECDLTVVVYHPRLHGWCRSGDRDRWSRHAQGAFLQSHGRTDPGEPFGTRPFSGPQRLLQPAREAAEFGGVGFLASSWDVRSLHHPG